MPPNHLDLHPRAGGRISGAISSGVDGASAALGTAEHTSAALGTAELIGIVGAIFLAVVIVVLVCVIHSKREKNESEADMEYDKDDAQSDFGSGGRETLERELKRDQMYEWHRERAGREGSGVPGQGTTGEETVNLLPAMAKVAMVRG